MEDELRQLATTDPLTGASNRRHFIEQAAEELDRSRRYGFRIAMLMLDIDHFKTINDNHGHNVGDEVLKSIVACCHRELRSSDLFGRFGGEEFAAVLVETNREAAENTCRRLLRAIAGLAIGTPRGEVAVTVSIGLTLLAADDRSLDPLLKRADDALYEAKRSGRNRVVCL
jgi:diguanylate cyclase (GGDEF)-like protein